MLNYRQLIIDQLNFRATTPVPYARLMFEDSISTKIDNYYGSQEWQDKLHNSINIFLGIKIDAPQENICIDEYGITWRYGMGAKHVEKPPLTSPTLKGYSFPNVNQLCPDELLNRVEKDIAANGKYFSLVSFDAGLFERVWMLRGFENALMDIIAEPAFYEDLISAVAEHQLQIIERLVQTSADGIYFSDDWGEQRGVVVGAQRWRKFVKPHIARMYKKAHNAGKYIISHCCGNISEIITDCVEIGLNCLQSVQPEAMNPYDLKRQFTGKMAFWGGLGSQSTVPFGTPAEIKSEIRRLRTEMSQGGGYILGPAKTILNDTPLENAIAILEAFNEEYKFSPVSSA